MESFAYGSQECSAIFQRMMEYILQDHKEFADPYIDDIIIGTKADNPPRFGAETFAGCPEGFTHFGQIRSFGQSQENSNVYEGGRILWAHFV